MMYWSDHMTTGGWIFSIAVTLIALGLIVAAFAWLIVDRGSPTAVVESTREILDRRLASGELNPEQYRQLSATLTYEQATTPDSRPRRPVDAPR